MALALAGAMYSSFLRAFHAWQPLHSYERKGFDNSCEGKALCASPPQHSARLWWWDGWGHVHWMGGSAQGPRMRMPMPMPTPLTTATHRNRRSRWMQLSANMSDSARSERRQSGSLHSSTARWKHLRVFCGRARLCLCRSTCTCGVV